MTAIEPGLNLLVEAGMGEVETKSRLQTDLIVRLWRSMLEPLGVSLMTPTDSNRRASHVAFGHSEALKIDRCLIEEMDVIPDFRTPSTIRFGVAPLYNSFAEIFQAVDRMRKVILERRFERFSADRTGVT